MTRRWERELRTLKDVPAPLERIRERAARPPAGDASMDLPPRRQRIVAGMVAFAVFAVAGAFAWRAFEVDSAPIVTAPSNELPVLSVRLDGSGPIDDGSGGDLRRVNTVIDYGDAPRRELHVHDARRGDHRHTPGLGRRPDRVHTRTRGGQRRHHQRGRRGSTGAARFSPGLAELRAVRTDRQSPVGARGLRACGRGRLPGGNRENGETHSCHRAWCSPAFPDRGGRAGRRTGNGLRGRSCGRRIPLDEQSSGSVTSGVRLTPGRPISGP